MILGQRYDASGEIISDAYVTLVNISTLLLQEFIE
jgi:hypothetical protein